MTLGMIILFILIAAVATKVFGLKGTTAVALLFVLWLGYGIYHEPGAIGTKVGHFLHNVTVFTDNVDKSSK